MNDFVHLHLHSEYSLLDGACRVSEIPLRAKECGHRAAAITDHGVMYGVIDFYNACLANGIKPVIGCEVYVASGTRFDKAAGPDNSPCHLVLLCKDNRGYANLVKMVSKSFTEGFYGKPRVDMELLRRYSDGLIALSACLAGRIPRALVRGEYSLAVNAVNEYKEIFGEDNFFIELQDHGTDDERQIIPDLVRLAEDCHVGLVATNDCHYLRRRDAEVQAILLCIQTNNVITDGRPIGFETDEFYYKDTSEMEMMFGKYNGAIENTVKIADMCNVTFDFDKIYLPKFPVPSGLTATEYLKKLTDTGFNLKISEGLIDFSGNSEAEYRQRMDYEFGVITGMGYTDYYLIVQDYVMFAKRSGIPVGPGRGSGAGSLVAYCLGITDVDPLKYNLLFERFLNPERVSMPDFDVDFCYNRRGEVIEYVTEKYGPERVSQIIAFDTLAARAAVKNVGRAMGMPYAEVDAVAKAIPRDLDITIAKALKMPELKALYEDSAKVRELVDIAASLEGMPRNVSIHAAGIIISDKPVSDYVPLALSNGAVITQFDMDTVAHLGLLKFDFLALRYLTIISDAGKQIREEHPDFDIEKININDRATYELISKGNTSGVFQLESSGMRQVLTRLRPENINDIVAVIALYRPGPMDSISRYIECRHDESKIFYDLAELEPILRETYGCTVYQEQVMQIFRSIAGYTFGRADIVRRAMSKKKADVLAAERESFIAGAQSRGIDSKKAEKLFNDMSSFANYAFNKSHAVAYAALSYRTAYLKAHYPQAYFSALLTSVLNDRTKVIEYITECNKMGIRVLPPSVNHSRPDFSAEGQNIRFGMAALKNVGVQFIENINRVRGGGYKSLEDFINRMADTDLNKRQVEALIKAGAFDGLGAKRSQMLTCYEGMIDRAQEKSRNSISGQMDMFAADNAPAGVELPTFRYPDIPEYGMRELLALEKDVSGMYFSGNLLDGYSKCISDIKAVSIAEMIQTDEDGDLTAVNQNRVRLAGMINSITTKTTKRDERMAFFRLEDRTGEIECIAFAKTFAQYSQFIRVDSAVFVEGSFSQRDDDAVKFIVASIGDLIPDDKYTIKESTRTTGENKQEIEKSTTDYRFGKLFLRVPDTKCIQYKKAANLIELFDSENTGGVSAIIYDTSTSKYSAYSQKIILDAYIVNEFRQILGEENVVFKPQSK